MDTMVGMDIISNHLIRPREEDIRLHILINSNRLILLDLEWLHTQVSINRVLLAVQAIGLKVLRHQEVLVISSRPTEADIQDSNRRTINTLLVHLEAMVTRLLLCDRDYL